MFRVDVKDMDTARQKVEAFFKEKGVTIMGDHFQGRGFVGSYAPKQEDGRQFVEIIITDSPFWCTNTMLINAVKGFLEGV